MPVGQRLAAVGVLALAGSAAAARLLGTSQPLVGSAFCQKYACTFNSQRGNAWAYRLNTGDTVLLSRDKSTLQIRLTANEIRGHITFNAPKTRSSLLTAHRNRQEQERQALEEGWTDSGLVFASDVGTPLSNANLRRLFIVQSTRAGLPPLRLHDMRYTAATAMIRRGYTAKLVADILGHSDPGFTLREYAHVWDEQRRESAPSAADLYGPPTQVQPAAFN